MTTETSETTKATTLADSPPVAEALETILRHLAQAQSAITAIRAPSPEHAESYEQTLTRHARRN